MLPFMTMMGISVTFSGLITSSILFVGAGWSRPLLLKGSKDYAW